MKSKGCLCLFVLGANVLAGCTNGGAAGVEPASVSAYQTEPTCEVDQPSSAGFLRAEGGPRRPGAISLDCFRFPQSKGKKDSKFAYELAVTSQVKRDRLTYILIGQADSICTIEKARMLERQVEVNTLLSIATTGLSIASTIVTGQRASDILSGSAAFTSGSRDHLNTHVYRNQIIQTVTTAIDTKRTEALGLIQANLKKTKESYPIDAAIRDVNAYHQLCSFSTGIQLVMEAVEKQQAYEDAIKLGQIESELIRLGRDLNIAGLDTPGGQAIAAQMNRLRQERILRTTGFDLAPPSPQDASEQDTSGAEGEATEETPAAADDPA